MPLLATLQAIRRKGGSQPLKVVGADRSKSLKPAALVRMRQKHEHPIAPPQIRVLQHTVLGKEAFAAKSFGGDVPDDYDHPGSGYLEHGIEVASDAFGEGLPDRPGGLAAGVAVDHLGEGVALSWNDVRAHQLDGALPGICPVPHPSLLRVSIGIDGSDTAATVLTPAIAEEVDEDVDQLVFVVYPGLGILLRGVPGVRCDEQDRCALNMPEPRLGDMAEQRSMALDVYQVPAWVARQRPIAYTCDHLAPCDPEEEVPLRSRHDFWREVGCSSAGPARRLAPRRFFTGRSYPLLLSDTQLSRSAAILEFAGACPHGGASQVGGLAYDCRVIRTSHQLSRSDSGQD